MKAKDIDWIVIAPCFREEDASFTTKGIDKYLGVELELKLIIDPMKAAGILNLIGMEIAKGRVFKDWDKETLIFSAPFVCRRVFNDKLEAEFLRIIIPDKNFKYPWDEGCEEPFRSQM